MAKYCCRRHYSSLPLDRAVAEAWNSSDLNVYQLQELSAAVDELGVVLRCRKALCDEGMKSLLELLKSRHSYYVS